MILILIKYLAFIFQVINCLIKYEKSVIEISFTFYKF